MYPYVAIILSYVLSIGIPNQCRYRSISGDKYLLAMGENQNSPLKTKQNKTNFISNLRLILYTQNGSAHVGDALK